MLSQNIPNHFNLKKEDFSIRKDIILINDLNCHTEYYNNVPLHITSTNKLSFSDLISKLKTHTNSLARAILYIQFKEGIQLIGADPFIKTKYIDFTPIK
jgi:hypothetical protein